MKLFTNEEIRAIDRYTIEVEGTPSLDLIERVGEGVADEICARWRPSKPTVIFAGPGNNGADALCAGRVLIERGWKPQIFLFNPGGDKLSADCVAMRERLTAAFPEADFREVVGRFTPPDITPNTLVIDGLFGSGLREELQGGFKTLVQYINEESRTVVSIDIPSGMFGDWNPQLVSRNVIHATLTLAIQFPRISFFIPDSAEMVGEWKVLDIGLSPKAIAATPASFCLVEKRDARRLRHRMPFCSKADFGNGVLYAGSYGMMGAAVLAARGALRSGIGKLTVCAPKCGYEIIQTSVPEALFRYNRGEGQLVEIHPDRHFNAIAVGPGIGTNELTVKAVEAFLAAINQPVVLDADALNCIALKPAMLNTIPVLSILTPHAGEFDRMFGPQPSGEARLRKAIETAKFYNIILILKGRYTAIVRPDGKVYFNSSGCPAMATAGSGDVLTGMILSLLAQGYSAELASILAVFVHGLAGEMAQADQGEYGVTASDIASKIGPAIREIMQMK